MDTRLHQPREVTIAGDVSTTIISRHLVVIVLKCVLKRAQNMFMPRNVNCITIIITLKSSKKIKKRKKMATKRLEDHFFHQYC